MINAKEELISKLKEVKYVYNDVIICASIYFGAAASISNGESRFELIERFNQHEFDSFLDGLDFEYDNGYGVQNLYGTIWLTNGAWLEREEYDGAECWRYLKCPELPIKISKLNF
jgi:hypothetical protein